MYVLFAFLYYSSNNNKAFVNYSRTSTQVSDVLETF